MNLLRRLKAVFSRRYKYYTDIETLPCGLWNKVNETGNTTHARIEAKYRGLEDTYRSVNNWRSIQKQIVEKFGWSQEYKERLMRMRKIALLRIEAELTGQSVLHTFADVEQAQIDEELQSAKSFNFEQSIAILERELGFVIDTNTFSTLKYLQHIHLLNKTKQNGKD